MRNSFARTFSAIALAALATLVPATAASAAGTAKPAAWAKKHDLEGAWRAKDADRDGLKNLQEFQRATNPRKADTDRDGLKDGDEVKSGNDPLTADSDGDQVKDGAEHAGVVSAFDGESITIRQFHGMKLTATLDQDADCVTAADADAAGDTSGDDDASSAGDDGSVPVTGDAEGGDGTGSADAPAADGEEDVVDLGPEDDVTADDAAAGGCDMPDLDSGAVLRSAELEYRDGAPYVVALEVR